MYIDNVLNLIDFYVLYIVLYVLINLMIIYCWCLILELVNYSKMYSVVLIIFGYCKLYIYIWYFRNVLLKYYFFKMFSDNKYWGRFSNFKLCLYYLCNLVWIYIIYFWIENDIFFNIFWYYFKLKIF